MHYLCVAHLFQIIIYLKYYSKIESNQLHRNRIEFRSYR
jgi:hypothetical protein